MSVKTILAVLALTIASSVANAQSVSGDHDGDGKSDILWRNSSSGQNWMYLMNDASISSSAEVNTVSNLDWEIAGTGDFDGDIKADILWRNSQTGQNWLYLMNGASITSSVSINTVPTAWKVSGNADFNGDGRADILWRHGGTGQVWMYLMDGPTVVSSLSVTTVPNLNWQIVTTADFNNDGNSDILWRNSVTGQNWLYLMDGSVILTSVGINTVPNLDWQIVGSGDYNGDGKADILWRHEVTGQNWMYLMNGASITSSLGINTVSATWQVVGNGDYDGDGRSNILWRNGSTGQNWMYLMNGATISTSVNVNTVSDLNWEVVDSHVVRRLGNDVTLSALDLSVGTLTPAFDSHTLSYEATINVAELSVTPVASDAGATITVNGTPVSSGQPSPAIPMNLGLNGIVMAVTAEDGVSTSTYTVIVRRLNNEATLASLSVSAGALDPVFDPDQANYSMVTTASTYSVTPTANDVNASIAVNGSPVVSGATFCCQSLSLGNNTLTVEVTAQDGVITQTYTVTIYRQSTEARLGSLSVSAGSLSPVFSSNNDSYSLTVPIDVDSTSVTAAPLNANATTTVNGVPFSGTSDSIALGTGDNILTINVTAEDGVSIQSYSVTITRLNDDAYLAGIGFSTGALDQAFDPNVTSYTMTVSYPFTTVMPVASDPNAQIEVAGQIVSSGSTSGNVDLNLGFNSIVVQVTSTDASSTRTYLISVTRVINTDANLEGLEITAGTLTPNFAPTQYDYAVEAGFLATTIQVTPYTNPTSTILVNGEPVAAGEESVPITLTESSSVVVDIDITAEDGVSSVSYTLEITRQSAASFAQQAYVKASNPDYDDYFSRFAVAVYGDTVAVGAYWEDGGATGIDGDQANNGSPNAGAVYVFTRDSEGTWSQQAYVKASNTDAGDLFGASVALYGDTLAVGAYDEDSSASLAGAVYVFARDSEGIWSQQAYLNASNTDAGDKFGWSVALHGDTLAVGAFLEDSAATGIDGDQSNNSTANAGAVYIFTRDSAGTWSQQAYVKASNTDMHDSFGHTVAVYGDTLAVGTYSENSAATGINGDQADNNADYAGAVYVFTRDSEGTWSQQAYVKASNTDAEDYFGYSIGLHGDTLAVGAQAEASAAAGINGNQVDNSANASGATYVFTRDSEGTWSQQAYIKASNTGAEDYFGQSVALHGDILAVGAYAEDSAATGIDGGQTNDSTSYAGAVYVFTRDGAGTWSQQAYVKASSTDVGDLFGYSVAVQGDTLAIGAPREDSSAAGINGDQSDNSLPDSGAVYIFR